MKTILRNFLSVIKRFKMATILNIIGLSVAFAAFMVIMIQLDYDNGFDRHHPQADCIFRVEAQFDHGSSTQAIINRPLSDLFLKSSPHILAGALVNPWGGDMFFSIEKEGSLHYFQEKGITVYPEFVDVFSLDILEGEGKSLEEPDKALIPLSLARKLFGTASAVGQTLKGRNGSITVGGVYRDLPENSVIENAILRRIPQNENITNYGNWNYNVYIRVDQSENAEGLMENFKRVIEPSILGEDFSWEENSFNFRLTPIADIHFTTDVTYDATPKASRQTLLVLFAIAIIIVVIAAINFTNFSTALTPMRIKSINTQKVLGGDPSAIRSSLIFEAIGISLLAYLIALGILAILPFTPIAGLLDASLSIGKHLIIVGGALLIALLTGFFAGIYPAIYMTSFPPALVLKGSFGLSPKGRTLKNVLISVQFIASFALIIASFFMYLQNWYMQNTSLGYDKEQVIITNTSGELLKSKSAFIDQIKSYAGIDNITFSEPLLSSSDQYMGWGRMYKNEQINYQCLPVDPSFLDVMKIEITEGRGFREEDAKTRHGVYVFNQKAKEMYDIELGSMIDSATIVGFMPDVRFASFRTEVVPMAFYVWGTQNWGSQPNNIYIKVKAGSDMKAAMSHVRSSVKMFDADYPFNVRFFDEVFNHLYEKEQKLSSLITLFSLIAIFISMVGVFGLVVFDSVYRRKEIGVRKVLGSSTQQILIMFNKSYLLLLCLCFIIAAPVAWFAVHRWLENFAYRTPMYIWVYIVAFAIIVFITICTVTFQNWRAANDNPVNSIKTE
ncbi:putative ABC transport system permease protein [Parabacteroides sp. PFB2-10]|uniref:ABC transporter permease n=1 Tax=Parabacteroides sp. PFB2-10 TaxID=1742405 RepID=UPI0024754E97|nr:ABC transporter permease [Parabacteroides sp. PFB2-10]MDH6313540.1 putative ABC transport system permease protein [Parabacteroides sp. PFB2-10]